MQMPILLAACAALALFPAEGSSHFPPHHQKRHASRHDNDEGYLGDPLPPHAQRVASLAAERAVEALMDEDTPQLAHAVANSKDVAEVYPRVHPVVGRALDDMDNKVTALKKQGEATQEDMESLTTARSEAMAHMNDGVALQHVMARLEANMRSQDMKLKALEAQESKFQREHDNLFQRLHSVMDPQMATVKERLHRHLRAMTKKEQELKKWDEVCNKYKKAALETLQERRKTLEMYKQAEETLAKAQQDVKTAERKYQDARNGAAQEVGVYKYAEAKYKAALSKEKAVEEGALQEKQSLKKLHIIFKAEKLRIEESLVRAQEDLQMRLRKAQLVREEAAKELQATKDHYKTWQEEQHRRAEETADKTANYRAASQAYSEGRKELLHAAEEKAGAQTVSDSDWAWDDWAWAGGKDPARTMEEVHLTD